MKTDLTMGNAVLSMLIIFFFCIEPVCIAQKEARIANTIIELKDNQIHITYDILNSQRSDYYNVRLEISDSTGNIIDARTVKGDIGENVSGGGDKVIIWNHEDDDIYIDADIFIQIYASGVLPGEVTITKSDTVVAKSFNRTGIILQSVAFPGLGLSRMTGQPHWLRGVAGYGCIAGSIVLNRMAIATYEDYRIPGSTENARSLLAETNKQDNISEMLGYAAIAIWVTDIIWTIAGSSELKRTPLQGNLKGMSIGTGYDALSNVPLLAIRYEFSVK